jgi:hypothetical protein
MTNQITSKDCRLEKDGVRLKKWQASLRRSNKDKPPANGTGQENWAGKPQTTELEKIIKDKTKGQEDHLGPT